MDEPPDHGNGTSIGGAAVKSTSTRARLQLGVTLVGSSVAAVWSWTLGAGQLGTPSFRSLDLATWRQWASDRTALDMSMSVVRVGVLVAATLVAVSVVVAVVDGVRLQRSVGTARAIRALPLPSWLRRWRDLAFAVSLSAAVVAASTGAANAADRPSASALPRPTLAGAARHAGDPASGQKWPDFDALEGRTASPRATVTTTSQATLATTPSTATARTSTLATPPPSTTASHDVSPTTSSTVPGIARIRVTAQPRPTATRTEIRASGPAATTAVAGSTANPADQFDVSHEGRIVQHGESLWSIAESVVIGADPTADEHQVAEYWHRLIESNRSSLRNPSNADLLYPGDVVKLPVPG